VSKARVVLILNGRHDDRGFVQEGYEGALRASRDHGFHLEVVEYISKSPYGLQQQVEKAAKKGALGVIVHGSRADAAVDAVAPKYPDCSFLSPGGRAAGTNVWNYAVRHFEAAYLAGVLAARSTRSGTVGHLSGVFISPGRKGRAAYVDGVRAIDPSIRIVTGFCGDQDDPKLAERWIDAEAKVGADIIFTMLNYGRTGAIDACRAHGIHQIGNIRNWCNEEPDVFIGSALSRHSWSIRNWIGDLLTGKLESGHNLHPGLEVPEAVGLAIGQGVVEEIRDEIAEIAAEIVAGTRVVNTDYDGPEFSPDASVEEA